MAFRRKPSARRPEPHHRYLDVLIGRRVYSAVQWRQDTNEVVIINRAEPLAMPFRYVRRWRPRASHNDMGNEPWRDGPFAKAQLTEDPRAL